MGIVDLGLEILGVGRGISPAGIGAEIATRAAGFLFGGDDPAPAGFVPGTTAPARLPSPGPVATFVPLDDGSRVLVAPSGAVSRPQFFLPLGARFPGGATIVSVSPDGQLFGLRRKRKRRTFGAEIDRCLTTISAASKLITAVKKK